MADRADELLVSLVAEDATYTDNEDGERCVFCSCEVPEHFTDCKWAEVLEYLDMPVSYFEIPEGPKLVLDLRWSNGNSIYGRPVQEIEDDTHRS